jgi:microcystin-dependent protein
MSEPFIGQITMFGGNFAPRGWALCDGQLQSISANSALFSILGTTYGGDGVSTFGLPDLRSRVPMHAGTGPGLSNRRLGTKAGHETVTLTTNQMPSHNHSVACVDNVESTKAQPGGHVPGPERAANADVWNDTTPDNTMAATMIGNTGGGQPVNTLPPYQVVNFIIAMQGVYPSRS